MEARRLHTYSYQGILDMEQVYKARPLNVRQDCVTVKLNVVVGRACWRYTVMQSTSLEVALQRLG